MNPCSDLAQQQTKQTTLSQSQSDRADPGSILGLENKYQPINIRLKSFDSSDMRELETD